MKHQNRNFPLSAARTEDPRAGKNTRKARSDEDRRKIDKPTTGDSPLSLPQIETTFGKSMKILVNLKYAELDPWLRQLTDSDWFDRNGTLLHAGRNTIKRFEVNGLCLVVKRYGRPTIVNRLIYGTLRRSKAMRAYLHAARLLDRGIETPEMVAAIDIRRRGLLETSYFVSRCSEGESMRTVTERFATTPRMAPILDAFARFLFRVHNVGVFHEDLNIDNILYRRTGEEYRFELIDTNRMSFHRRLSKRRRLDNLRRLSCAAPAYLRILNRYAELVHSDPNSIQFFGVLMRLRFEFRQRCKRNIRRKIHKAPNREP